MLNGVKVVEVAGVITGPLAGMTLADLGAEVIKVEPVTGDQFRGWEGSAEGVRPSFGAINRGKLSIGVDLKSEPGRAVVLDLVKHADVFIENSRPGAMDRLGLGPETLRDHNRRLVYCSVTGMGSGGPETTRPTYDAVAQAMSGLWSQITETEDPQVVGPPFADQLAGLYSAIAILGALLEREKTGQGRAIEVSMLASCLAFQGLSIASYTQHGEVSGPTTRSVNSQSYAFVAADGLPFAIHLSTPQRFWTALCNITGHPELVEDARFVTKGDRIAHYAELREILSVAFKSDTREEWLAKLAEADVPSAPILNLAEALAHPHVQALRMVVTDDAGGRTAGFVKSPVVTGGGPVASERPAPLLGEHADEILRAAGRTQQQIDELREAGMVT